MRILWYTGTDFFHSAQINRLNAQGYFTELYRSSRKRPVRPRVFLSLLKKSLRNFDIIFCDFLGDGAVLLQKAMKLSPRKPCIVGRVHRYEVFTKYPSQLKPSVFQHVISVSKWTKEKFLLSNPSFSEEQVSVIYNGIDTNVFSTDLEKKPVTEKFVTVGNIIPIKGIYDLIQNWSSKNQLSIVGAKRNEDYYQYITEMIEQRDLSDIISLEGIINNNDLPEFLEDKTFYVNHAINESFSVATMEAISCGLLPMIRDWPAAWEIYPHEYIYRNISEFQKLKSKLLALDESEIIQRRKELRNLVEKRFSVDQQILQMIKVFEFVVNS